MHYIIDFANKVIRNSEGYKLKAVVRTGDDWHRVVLRPHGGIKVDYNKVVRHVKKAQPDFILEHVCLANNEGVYLKTKHIEPYVDSFSVDHLKMYSNVEQYVDDCLKKQFGIVERLAPLRFHDFSNYNIKIMQNLDWINVDIDEYFDVREMKPMWYFKENVKRVFEFAVCMNLDKVETEYALQRFEEFYNTQRLGRFENAFGDNWKQFVL